MVDLEKIGEHVSDIAKFEFPFGVELELPKVFGYQVTKYMVIEAAVALVLMLIFIPLARRIATGQPVRGRVANLLEAMLLFLRDEVARPSIGRHDADRFLPFIWSIFFFVLGCNLTGSVPWAGSPTGALAVTAVLAASTFLVVIGSGMLKYGVGRFWIGLIPHMDLPLVLAIFLYPMLFVIEVVGLLIKHAVLAVRLLANVFAGHLVLAVIISFIAATAHSIFALWMGVTVASMAGYVALSLLELFVAFLQAYIFAFLSALFIGMAVHQH